MAKFGFGKGGGRKSYAGGDDFGQVLTSLGISAMASQQQLWKIYNAAESRGDVNITETLDKYFDWWN